MSSIPANPYASKQPITNPYTSKQPVTNPYTSKQPITNPYTPKQPVTNPYTSKQQVTNPYAPKPQQSNTMQMTHNLSLGAINKQTGDYVYPKIANKKDEYVCPDCNKDLILCQGEIIRPYFRHKVDSVNPCNHYSNPTETQIHKDGKMVMKSLLERKTPISFVRNCCSCKKNEEHEIPEMTESSKIELEYRFEYNGTKIADVAYIDNGDIFCIFEICNTHKTSSEKRPEPWFEIDAITLIKLANDSNVSHIKIPCIRCEKCDDCIEEKLKKEKRKKCDECRGSGISEFWEGSKPVLQCLTCCCSSCKKFEDECLCMEECEGCGCDFKGDLVYNVYKLCKNCGLCENCGVYEPFMDMRLPHRKELCVCIEEQQGNNVKYYCYCGPCYGYDGKPRFDGDHGCGSSVRKVRPS
jgi:uncharacterized protein YkuJ